MARKPRISTDRLYQGMAKKGQIGPDRRRFLVAAVAGVVASVFGGKALLNRFRKAQLKMINAEHEFLNKSSFSTPQLRREWARISHAIETNGGVRNPEQRLRYLKLLDGVLREVPGVSPIDVVRTIRSTPPTTAQAIRVEINIMDLRKTQPSNTAEITRLTNVAKICRAVAALGKDGEDLNNIINRVPPDVFDVVLNDKKAGRL